MELFQIDFFHLRFYDYSISLQCFIAHFLLVLNNIPLSGMHHGLSAHLLKNILVAPKFWQLWINLQYTSMDRLLCGHIFVTPLGEYQGMQLLDCIVRTCFIKKKKKKRKTTHQGGWTIIPSSDAWEFLLHLFFFSTWCQCYRFCHSIRCMVASHCFTLHFPRDIWCGIFLHI